MELDGRTVLVTGSSRNIGRSIATTMAERGADVGITGRSDEEACKETASRVNAAGGDAAIALGDLGDPDDIVRVVETIRDALGPIDVLVNNAAIRPRRSFDEVTVDEFDEVVAVNLRGTFRTTQLVMPDMLESGQGSIINVLGTFVYMGLSGFSHSFSSKSGTAGLVRQLASELGPEGIRVNGIAPGSIDTVEDGSDDRAEIRRRIVEATPLKRQGQADEIADVCSFLASERASFITGQVIHVNGGLYPTPNLLDG